MCRRNKSRGSCRQQAEEIPTARHRKSHLCPGAALAARRAAHASSRAAGTELRGARSPQLPARLSCSHPRWPRRVSSARRSPAERLQSPGDISSGSLRRGQRGRGAHTALQRQLAQLLSHEQRRWPSLTAAFVRGGRMPGQGALTRTSLRPSSSRTQRALWQGCRQLCRSWTCSLSDTEP